MNKMLFFLSSDIFWRSRVRISKITTSTQLIGKEDRLAQEKNIIILSLSLLFVCYLHHPICGTRFRPYEVPFSICFLCITAMSHKCHGISITCNSTVCSAVCSGLQQQIKYLYYWPFVRWTKQSPADSLHNGPVRQKPFPCNHAIMSHNTVYMYYHLQGILGAAYFNIFYYHTNLVSWELAGCYSIRSLVDLLTKIAIMAVIVHNGIC